MDPSVPITHSISCLIDSGSTDNFIDSSFVQLRKSPTHSIPPVTLRLLNGSTAGFILEITLIPISFPGGEILSIDHYVTNLDSSCQTVLGYSFLSRYNPLIDWVTGRISFQADFNQPESCPGPATPPNVRASSFTTPKSKKVPPWPFEPVYLYPNDITQRGSQLRNPPVTIIGAAAFLRCCKESNFDPMVFCAYDVSETNIFGSVVDNIPDYLQEFADVFDEGLSNKLAPHCSYNLKINLEEGCTPPVSRIYPVSKSELGTLRNFIEEHLRNQFIQTSSLTFAAPVLLVKKKSGELRLCINF